MKYLKTYEQNSDFTELIKKLTDFSKNKQKDYDELKILIFKHKDLINVGKFYKPISIAISTSDIMMLQLLIEAGADVNLPISQDNSTPLYKAVVSDNIDMIRILIKAGANVNIGCTVINQPPLILAFNRYINSVREEKNLDIVHELIKAGADWSLEDSTNANRNHNDFVYYIDYYKKSDYFIELYPEKYEEYLINKAANAYDI